MPKINIFVPNTFIFPLACFFVLFLNLFFVIIFYTTRKTFVDFTKYFSQQLKNISQNSFDNEINLELETLDSKLSHDLKKLYQINSSMRRRMEEEHINIKEIISDMAHQIRTPVANLQMYNSTLLERDLPIEKQKAFREIMETQIEKIEFLVQSMIKMSHLEAGIMNISTKPLPIFNTIASSIQGILLKSERKNIDISVNCSIEIIVEHDKNWTTEAIYNILENAVKYTPASGSIHINVEKWKTLTKIDIIDTGVGISKDHYAQIFRRFYREEKNQDQEGVGIGLYLAREIIHKQNGHIMVSSKIKKGSTFSVFMPNASI